METENTNVENYQEVEPYERIDFLVFGDLNETAKIVKQLKDQGYSADHRNLSQTVISSLFELSPRVVIYQVDCFDAWGALQQEIKSIREKGNEIQKFYLKQALPFVPEIWIGVCGEKDAKIGEEIVRGHGHEYFTLPLKDSDLDKLKTLKDKSK